MFKSDISAPQESIRKGIPGPTFLHGYKLVSLAPNLTIVYDTPHRHMMLVTVIC